MAEANLHKDLELSSSRSDSSSEKDSRLEPSSDGEIFDDARFPILRGISHLWINRIRTTESFDPFCNGDGNEHL